MCKLKTLNVKSKVWKQLQTIRIEKGINTLNGVIELLLKNKIEYKKGFRDGMESCKPNKKLDKANKKGLEV